MAMPHPSDMKLATVYGGSGFVGRYVARRLAYAGWRVRVACRRPEEALFVRTYGTVGQVEPMLCNVRDDASVAKLARHADAVVNCVGILAPQGRNTFHAVQAEAPGRIARIGAGEGARVVHVSAIGADADSASVYQRTKAEGEAGVLAVAPGATILRPSIVFGPEDQFFNRFAAMARRTPVIPVIGASTRFQPVYVDDVAAVAERAVRSGLPGTYELGGPEIATFRGLLERMLRVIGRKRLIASVPFWAGTAMGAGFDLAGRASFGLIQGPVTRDQVRNLRLDNVVGDGAPGFGELGMVPTAMDAVLEDYLWRFRPSGQYAEIKDSARDLRAMKPR